ncbi:MAG: ribonuclease III [Patescibacteria group bacterium]
MLEKFQEKIKYKFRNSDLLTQAFTHRSYLNENKSFKLAHNERLEFLGDAVLELVSTEYLYEKYPKKSEGKLTSVRAALVNTVSLAGVAKGLDIDSHLLLSKGEAKDRGRARGVILANAFEALVGAIYLDGGYKPALKFLKEVLLEKADEVVAKNLWQDPKSVLQEKAQDTEGVTPVYKTIKEVGPDHAKTFTVGVYFGTKLIAKGTGQSKQEAETEAAKLALSVMS